MTDKITKDDWKKTTEQFSNLLVNSLLSAEIQQVVLDYAKKKLSEFPEDDPMPEGVKDIVKDLK